MPSWTIGLDEPVDSPNTNALMAELSMLGKLPNEIIARSLETSGRYRHATHFSSKNAHAGYR
jgi:hypothetical protein